MEGEHQVTKVLVGAVLMLGGLPTAQLSQEQPTKYPFCNSHECDERVDFKRDQRAVRRLHRKIQKRHKAQVRWQATMLKVVAPYSARLDRMAQCESGGRWNIATGNGFYGGLQFTLNSWWAVGGRGMPNLASILEQKYRAVKLMFAQGWGAWPVCAYR